MNGASLMVNFTLEGYTAALTLNGESGAELLGKAGAVIQALQDLGATPTGQALASNGNGNAEPETKICPLHHAPMKKRTGKGGDVWYSHKAVDATTGAEYWCRGTERKM